MKKLFSFFSKPGIIFCSAALALALIFLSFLNFRVKMNSYIEEDMYSQLEAIQKNSTLIIQKEMNYLRGLTVSVAEALNYSDIETDEDILRVLEDYSNTAHIVRTLFITLDGHVYTSYAGYLGKYSESPDIDGIPLSEIKGPVFSQPYYAEDLHKVIFGVVTPAAIGKKQGVLVSSYNVEEFSVLLGDKSMVGPANVGIVNSSGEVVCGTSADEFQINIFDALHDIEFQTSSVKAMRDDFSNEKSGFTIYRVKGVARYCAYAPVGLNDWFVIVTVKENILRGKLANLEKYGFWLTVELVIIMLGLLCVIIANRREEQKKIRSILEQAAMMDGLTGIYNRKAAEDIIEQSLRKAGKDSRSVLLVMDLDDFKGINDQGGHLFGDRVLREFARRLKSLFGDEGIVGRIGGDEFLVFLRDGRDMEGIANKINGLIDSFCVPTDTGEFQKISISVGIGQAGPEADSFMKLYRMADAALYRAKQSGKARLSN